MTAFANVEEVQRKPIEVPQTRIAEEMKEKLGSAADVVDSIVATFNDWFQLGDGGLYELAIEPVTGDFNQVKANADAWRNVSEMFYAVQTNLKENAKLLVDPKDSVEDGDWTGEAARAFFDHVDLAWVAGIYVAGRVAGWMAKGFDKLSEVVRNLATKCATLLRYIVDRIVSLAKKAVPIAGQILAVLEWIVSGFDLDEFPYLGDVRVIARMIGQLREMKRRMDEVVATARGYIDKFTEAVQAINLIPIVEAAGATAEQIGVAYQTGVDQAQANRQAIEEKADQAGDVLENIGKADNIDVDAPEQEIWTTIGPFSSRNECELAVTAHMDDGFECKACVENVTGQWEFDLKEKQTR